MSYHIGNPLRAGRRYNVLDIQIDNNRSSSSVALELYEQTIFYIEDIMPETAFDGFSIYDDDLEDLDIMRSIVESKNQKKAFYILDVARVVKQHIEWIRKMPRIIPHYAMKCNPDPTVINTLAALNANFDCASQQEIQQILAAGVSAKQIIFANPAKQNSHIKYAKNVGVDKMTVDGKEEIMKIKEIFPTAKLVIRIRNDSLSSTLCPMGKKFGCDSETEAPRLIKLINELDMDLHGFSFHPGSPCTDAFAYSKGIKICKNLIDYSRSIGLRNVRIIDIGGGFLGLCDEQLESVAHVVNEALKDIDSSIEVISEPGRFYVEGSFTLATQVHSKKEIIEGNITKQNYYVNDGCHGSFFQELLGLVVREPIFLYKKAQTDDKFISTIWGPTCDYYDCIVKDQLLPKYSIGDWIVWRNMGAYTIAVAGNFNGFSPPDVYPFIRKSQINFVKTAIDEAKGNLSP